MLVMLGGFEVELDADVDGFLKLCEHEGFEMEPFLV
jgi:hypothetical protein